ncbi:MAG: UvrD-helicase domain-containing protein [Pseudomonadota bacterium]
MRSLSGLNPQQVEAVRFVDGHLLVVAGAGSGKTRVLTHKIAYLIEECSVRPSEICAVTFTNKAAGEMKERIRTLLPSFEQPQWVGTFHSVCLRILKEFHAEAGLPPLFTVYDESDQLSAMKRALSDLNYDPKQLPPKVIRYHIDRAKNETYDVLPYLKEGNALTQKGLEVAKRYGEVLAQNQALDFGDLLTRVVRLLHENRPVAETLRRRWKRLLIDEYQDTNKIQKELVRELAGTSGIVCAVGDEDQSIYSWRGARVENMLEFSTDFPNARLVKLEQNYRSTKKILQTANHVISHNIGRRAKTLWTENGDGSEALFFHAEDDHREASFVLDRVQELLRPGTIHARDIALFYRTHVQSRLLEEECRRRDLPYRIFGGTKFYERAEIKDSFAYLKLIVNPSDDVAFERAIKTPSRGIGAKTVENLRLTAEQLRVPALSAVPRFQGHGKSSRALSSFYTWFTKLAAERHDIGLPDLMERILDESGYISALEEEKTVETESRLENLQELLRSMQEFSEETNEGVEGYLDRISLIADTDSYDPQADTIVLMTMHNAKGLEFDRVFIVGMEEGIFPHQRSLEDGDLEGIEEERRLCYVAMTRARKELTLTGAARRRLYQSTQYNPVSRFISEIPANLLVQMEDPLLGGASHLMKRKGHFARDTYDEYRQYSYDEEAGTKGTPYRPGARVLHPDFGIGTIRKCEGRPDNLKLTVHFQAGGTRKLLLNYCTLEVVDR